MNDIKFSSKTLKECSVNIDIDLCRKFDVLTFRLETMNGIRTFDLVNVSEKVVDDSKYPNETLEAVSRISLWCMSFKYLLEGLFEIPNDLKLARIEDKDIAIYEKSFYSFVLFFSREYKYICIL